MPGPELICQQCGEPFTLPLSVKTRYPNWTPKACLRCRKSGPEAESGNTPKRAGGNSITRVKNLTTAEILERFAGGPQTGVFTDGSCAGNPGPGGWGAVYVRDGRLVAQEHGSDPATTNNRMELTAMIVGLCMLTPNDRVTVHSDSQLVVNTLTRWAAGWEARGWRRKEGEVKNLDLVKEAFALMKERPRVRIEWIRAHDGSRWNEYADALSTAYLRDEVSSNEAGLKFFILGVFVAGLLAYGISLVFGETGKLVFSDIASAKATPGLIIGFLLIFAALGFKIGAVPFHSWIPDTYHGAPTPVTAFLSIAPKGAAFAILLRMFFVSLATFKPAWVLLLVGASILSMTYGNIVAIAQKNIKRLLAYSGIAQIGNLLIGLAAGTKMGSDAILYYLLTYLFANLGAFAVVITVSNQIQSDEIEDYSGLNRRSPFLAFAMIMFLLSLAGVPPLAGFLGKLYIFVAAMNEGLYTLILVGLINIVISMYYYLIVVKKMYINEPTDPSPLTVSAPMQAVIYVSLAGTVILGVYPQPFIDWVVAAGMMFSHFAAPAAAAVMPSVPPSALPFGG